MEISGLIQSYDSRVISSAPMNRSIMAPEYLNSIQYTAAPSGNIVAQHQNVHQNPFSYNPYTGGDINVLVPVPPFGNNYMQRPPPRPAHPQVDGNCRQTFAHNSRQSFGGEIQSQSPPIKCEPQWNPPAATSSSFISNSTKTISSITPTSGSSEIIFGTEVDTLMKAIQAKAQTTQSQNPSSMDQSRSVVGVSRTPQYTQFAAQAGVQVHVPENGLKLPSEEPQDGTGHSKNDKKRYVCTMEECSKSFYQKTHLDIHERSHTGAKPYTCSLPGCGRTFSQLGNLKTHQRRHTGERPYHCEICGKRFAQRGNVRAHRIVHDQAKPYLCRLDDCGKQFTQLGNLKSHQNKFHAPTIRDLTAKFASIKDGDIVNAADKDLWEYFANLYKNSNKGIKGRGKDRKVGPSNPMTPNFGLRSLGISSRGGYSMTGAGRANMGMMSANHGLKIGNQYDMFDADDNHSRSNSESGSSVATRYDDAPSDGFDNRGRSGELAFGDRIY